MRTADLDAEGICPYCGSVECVGLTNGNGMCSCGAEFLLPTVSDEAQIEHFAKLAVEWRAMAVNTARTKGYRAASFYHGCANLWTNLLPPARRVEVEQMDAFPAAQEETDAVD